MSHWIYFSRKNVQTWNMISKMLKNRNHMLKKSRSLQKIMKKQTHLDKLFWEELSFLQTGTSWSDKNKIFSNVQWVSLIEKSGAEGRGIRWKSRRSSENNGRLSFFASSPGCSQVGQRERQVRAGKGDGGAAVGSAMAASQASRTNCYFPNWGIRNFRKPPPLHSY